MSEALTTFRGQLLLDSGQLAGSFFHRTVVLICQHDAEGAFGLVLNRSSGNRVGDALMAEIPESLREETLYLGGPVQPAALSYLHADEDASEEAVIPHLKLAHSLDDLIAIGEAFDPARRVRIFAGYSGWAGGQLEEEIRRGAWVMHPATLELAFDPDPEGLWRSILRQKGGRFRLLAEMPDDLSSN